MNVSKSRKLVCAAALSIAACATASAQAFRSIRRASVTAIRSRRVPGSWVAGRLVPEGRRRHFSMLPRFEGAARNQFCVPANDFARQARQCHPLHLAQRQIFRSAFSTTASSAQAWPESSSGAATPGTHRDIAGLFGPPPRSAFGGELGGFVDVYPTDFVRVRGELRRGIRSHDGVVFDLAADAFLDFSDTIRISGGPRVSWASRGYLQRLLWCRRRRIRRFRTEPVQPQQRLQVRGRRRCHHLAGDGRARNQRLWRVRQAHGPGREFVARARARIAQPVHHRHVGDLSLRFLDALIGTSPLYSRGRLR